MTICVKDIADQCLALFYLYKVLCAFFAIRRKIQINTPEKVLLQHVTMMRQVAGIKGAIFGWREGRFYWGVAAAKLANASG